MATSKYYVHSCDLSHLGELGEFEAPDGSIVRALQFSLYPQYGQECYTNLYIIRPSWTDELMLLDSDFVFLSSWYEKLEINDLHSDSYNYDVPLEEDLDEFPWNHDFSDLSDYLFPARSAFYLAETLIERYYDEHLCADCHHHHHNENFAVTDDVRHAAGMREFDANNEIIEGAQFLCVRCIEKRLKRQLTWKDFSIAPVNFTQGSTGRSERLLSRLRNAEGFSRTDLAYA